MTVHWPSHPHVPHPHHLLALAAKEKSLIVRVNDQVLEWVSRNILASILFFDIALAVPLAAIPAPDTVKLLVALVSGSWIQWWALPAVQRTQIKADAKRDAKADADHQAQSHIALTVDEVKDINTAQDARLARIEAHLGVAVPEQSKDGA